MEPTNETRKPVSPVEINLDPRGELAGLRILIVEDMGLVAMELRLMLDEMGCHIVGVASRLSEARKIAQTTERLDGVLLDLDLSGRSSYPVAEILQERVIPYIIISGYDASHSRAKFSSNGHLQKPFSHDDLARKMLHTFLPGRDV